MSIPLLTMELRSEPDVVTIRQRARQIAGLLGFDTQDQTRIATAVSEIARNAFGYAGGGTAEFSWDEAVLGLIIGVADKGPGIADLSVILNGGYRSQTGMGMGILGARRLTDGFDIRSAPGCGTTVQMTKKLMRRKPGVSAPDLAQIAQAIKEISPETAFQEVQRQNQELLRALAALHARETELVAVNTELGETNRGVVALYAELDEKAAAVQKASELKSRFLANMSHEFRTPLSSILSLTQLLLDRLDGPLTTEQEKQVGYTQKSAQALMDMVNDLLDLAKIESGMVDIQVRDFVIADMFSGLRGMFKPLLAARPVKLAFDEVSDMTLRTDEGKVSQILRNLIGNAVKFTPTGEVRIRAAMADDQVILRVEDTGIGIPQEHLDLIFEEFHQIHGAWQDKALGTGLGLPLSRKLAEALGGQLTVESASGSGSVFQLSLPRVYPKTIPSDPHGRAGLLEQGVSHA